VLINVAAERDAEIAVLTSNVAGVVSLGGFAAYSAPCHWRGDVFRDGIATEIREIFQPAT
jgi:hypothetical protein